MPRPRKPDELMELNGAWSKNPQRRRAPSPKSKHAIGRAPSYFSDDETAVWKEIVAYAATGVLTAADRMVVEQVCLTMAAIRRRAEISGAERSALTKNLSNLGMSPADRSKIAAVPINDDKPVDNPYAEFMQKPN